MSNKRILVKTTIGAVLVLGLAGAAPALAAHVAGTKVKIQRNIDVLNGQDQTVSVSVQVVRQDGPLKGHPTVGLEVFEHRAQVEGGSDDGNAHVLVNAPVIKSQGLFYTHEPGTPCNTCGPLDTVCALIGDRC